MYWKRCRANDTTLTARGTTLNFQLRLQLSSTKTRTPLASPRKRHLLSRARRGRSRASRRINRAFVLRSALDEALLEETLRFNLVAARTDFTLAQALSLGLLEVPMVVVFALVYARAASPFALGSSTALLNTGRVPGFAARDLYGGGLRLARTDARCALPPCLWAMRLRLLESARGSAFRSATRGLAAPGFFTSHLQQNYPKEDSSWRVDRRRQRPSPAAGHGGHRRPGAALCLVP